MSEHRDIIVVGSGVAGVKAAKTVREYNKERNVLVLSKDQFIYTKMALNYVVKRDLPIDFVKLYPDFNTTRIDFVPSTEVKKLNLIDKSIKLRSRGKDIKYTFSKLILAVGSKPLMPRIEGINKIGVFTFNEYSDAIMVNNYIGVGMKAFIIGAGLVGLLLADVLKSRGLDVTLIDKLPGVGLTIFEEELSKYLINKLVNKGVKVLTKASIDKIVGDKKDRRKVKKVIIDGYKHPADVVVFTLGVRPENRLAALSGLELGIKKAIRTNEKFETSAPDIYAIGDCATSIDYFTKKEVYRPLGTLAVSMAEVAGKNCIGIESSYEGFVPMQYFEVFDTSIIRFGLNTREAKELGLNSSKKIIKYAVPGIRSHPVSLLICLKDRQETIIGWQAASSWMVSYKSTIFMKAIRERMSLNEFLDTEKNVEIVEENF